MFGHSYTPETRRSRHARRSNPFPNIGFQRASDGKVVSFPYLSAAEKRKIIANEKRTGDIARAMRENAAQERARRR